MLPYVSFELLESVPSAKKENNRRRFITLFELKIGSSHAEKAHNTQKKQKQQVPWSNEKSNKVCLRMVILRDEHFILKLLVGGSALKYTHVLL